MATAYYSVPAGSTSNPYFITPLQNAIVGPSVLGGSVSLYFSPSLSIPLNQWQLVYSGTAGYAFRPSTTGYVYAVSATSAAQLFIADLGAGINGGTLVNLNAPLASASTTSEVILAAWKIPPNFLQANFSMFVRGSASLSNNANVKTLKLYANGTGGTAMATSPSVASALNYTFSTAIIGRGDGVSLLGGSVLASQTSAQGGFGISTTAQPTLSRNYLTQETEFTLTVTKATAGDTAQLEQLLVTLG